MAANIRALTFIFLLGLIPASAKAQTKQAVPRPDKLDAVAVAPQNHKVIYEDNKVRILQVTCPPGNEEPVHTHQYKSTMWFTQSARFIYYTYAANASGKLIKKDSTEVKGFPAEALNKGQMVDPEGPHSIKNISTDTLMAYRIEYKKEFKTNSSLLPARRTKTL